MLQYLHLIKVLFFIILLSCNSKSKKVDIEDKILQSKSIFRNKLKSNNLKDLYYIKVDTFNQYFYSYLYKNENLIDKQNHRIIINTLKYKNLQYATLSNDTSSNTDFHESFSLKLNDTIYNLSKLYKYFGGMCGPPKLFKNKTNLDFVLDFVCNGGVQNFVYFKVDNLQSNKIQIDLMNIYTIELPKNYDLPVNKDTSKVLYVNYISTSPKILFSDTFEIINLTDINTKSYYLESTKSWNFTKLNQEEKFILYLDSINSVAPLL
jgi:hypothetical protein